MSSLVSQFQSVKQSSDLAIIEGVQALKHAVRFEAEIQQIVTCDIKALQELLGELAPDISQMVLDSLVEVDMDTFAKISPKNHRTKVVSLAKRPAYKLSSIDPDKPIIFLENPKDLENIGAVIRVAAAADSGAVVTDAEVSIWHPGVIRGAAGLHFALPVLNCSLSELQAAFPARKLISLDPEGEDITQKSIPQNSILIFGTERHGISKETLAHSNAVLRLPMKLGVSSLNLATSVAATLYQI